MYRTYNIGQYIHGDSLLHKASLHIKVIFVIILSYLIFTSQNVYQNILLFAFVMSLGISMGIKAKEFKMIIKFSKMFIYFSLFSGLFKYSENYIFEFYIFKLSKEGLIISGQSSMRVIFMILLSVMITRSSSIAEFLKIFDIFKQLKYNKLFQKIGDMGLITVLSIRFVPLIFEEANRIRTAQSSRGLNFETKSIKMLLNNYSSFLGQLLVCTIKRAEIITLAIINKGYGMPATKNESFNISFNKSDFFICLLLLVVILLNNFYLSNFT